MKSYFTFHFLFSFLISSAQAPNGINYQAVALDGTGNPVSNQAVGIRLSILDGGPTGTLIYQETQAPSTDNTGLFSIVIGNGIVVSGTFAGINWGNAAKWLRTEIDITGGTSYVLMGSSQFMSTPYALYANTTNAVNTSFYHPDGLQNITPVRLVYNIPYVVPPGKNIYFNQADGLKIDTVTFNDGTITYGTDTYNMPGASAGSIVQFRGMAFLVDKTVDWVSLSIGQAPFTVPPGKQFVVICRDQYMSNSANCDGAVDGSVLNNDGIFENSVFDQGTVLSVVGSNCVGFRLHINGYLRDR